jgi:hypothetical protein
LRWRRSSLDALLAHYDGRAALAAAVVMDEYLARLGPIFT